jgi:thiamine-phosphate pyrophosphorylase
VAGAPGATERECVPRLYAIADSATLAPESTGPVRVVDAACAFADLGIGWIQLRLESLDDRGQWRVAEATVRRLEGYSVMLWINDRVDLGTILPFTGVHLGQHDLTPAQARRQMSRARIGLSTHDLRQLQAADEDPEVEVVAIGPVFATASKANPDPCIGLAGLGRARARTTKPLVAIGGITEETLPAVLATGVDSVAIIGALGRQPAEWRYRIPRLLAAAAAARDPGS